MKFTWWKAGLIGAITLSLTTVAKLVASVGSLLSGNSSIKEVVPFLGLIFAIGFACGVCVWALFPLAKKGLIGLAAVGFVCMNFFFLCCMAVFDPSLLSPDPRRGMPMFILASLLGPFAGVIIGRAVMQGLKEGRAELEEERQRSDLGAGEDRAERVASPNGGPAEPLGSSGVSGGPPSVS